MNAQEFEEIYHKYKLLLFRIAFTYVKNQADAEDILQEAFAKRLNTRKKFESDEHEKRWFIRITVNLAKDHLKSFWRKNRCTMEMASEEILEGMDIAHRQLLEEVLNLPDVCKVPMYLHYYEGYSCREIGELLHCKESTVKMRLKKGRELLKISLSDGGESYEVK